MKQTSSGPAAVGQITPPIVIAPREERLPPPYPGHSKAGAVTGPPREAQHPMKQVITTSQPSAPLPQPVHKPAQVEPPATIRAVPPSVEMQALSQALKSDPLAPVSNVRVSGSNPIQTVPNVPNPHGVVPIRLPVQAVLPSGKVPPLMFPPGVLPPPHLMRGVPPGHAVPIELVRGQRPAFISPTGHILIPTDQLQLLQQGRLIPRPVLPGPPPPLIRQQAPPQVPVQVPPQGLPHVRPHIPPQVLTQVPHQIQPPRSQAPGQLVRPAEPVGLAPAPVTPTMPSPRTPDIPRTPDVPRTPDIVEEQRSMEEELVQAAHMAEVGQSAVAGQLNPMDARGHAEASLPNRHVVPLPVRQPNLPPLRHRHPKSARRPPEGIPNRGQTTPNLPQSMTQNMAQITVENVVQNVAQDMTQEMTQNTNPNVQQLDGSTLADKYMKDWQPTGRYKCKFCHYSSVTQNFLFRHWVMSHSGVKPYLCAFCNLKSPTKDGITRHQTAKHKTLPREVLIDAEQEKLLVRKFRKVFTSLVPYRYHDYAVEDGLSDDDSSGLDERALKGEALADATELITRNNLGRSHENSKGVTETYIYRKPPDQNTNPEERENNELHFEGHQAYRDANVEGHRFIDQRSYPVLKKKIRQSFEDEQDIPEDMRIKPGTSDFQWRNEEPTSRLSELAGIALSSQAPPPNSFEATKSTADASKDSNPLVSPPVARPPVAIHPALQRPPMMLPPMDTLIRPQMLPHGIPGMVRHARPPYMGREASMPQLVSPENHSMNLYDTEMVQTAMAKHKDAQTIVQLLVSQKRDLPHDLQLPGSTTMMDGSVPNSVPQPPPAHQAGKSTSDFGHLLSPGSLPANYSLPGMVSTEETHVSLPTMAGMLKSPVITATNQIAHPGPYRDLPQLIPQLTHSTAGSLPPINELRSSANHSPITSVHTVVSSLGQSPSPSGSVSSVPMASVSSPAVSSQVVSSLAVSSPVVSSPVVSSPVVSSLAVSSPAVASPPVTSGSVSTGSVSSATAALLAAAAAAQSQASSSPEQVQSLTSDPKLTQVHSVETTSEAPTSSSMSSSPQVTSTSEEPVDGNANMTSSEDLQLKGASTTSKLQMINIVHSSAIPDQSQDAIRTSNVNSTRPEVKSS